MMKRAAALLLLLSSFSAVPVFAQYSGGSRMADLEQDVLALKAQMGDMRLAIEALQRENAMLRNALNSQSQGNQTGYATLQQLDVALGSLRQELLAADQRQKAEVIGEVSRQIDRLATQTQQALQAMSNAVSSGPSAAPTTITFSDDFPKNGVAYTVQPGDTLSGIAKKMNSNVRDIQNANKIADPTRIRVGQTLFIPQAKQ